MKINFTKIGDWVEGSTLNAAPTAGYVIGKNKFGCKLNNGKNVPHKNVEKVLRQEVIRVEAERILYPQGRQISRKPFIASQGRYV